jgi:two-component system alkaline phosphatase synthesis response regulator PhoP
MAYQTILVVDDEPHIVEVVRDYLEQAGFRVLIARDGQTALTMIRRERPDLIVLDLMLPGQMTGLDVCRGVRQEPDLADVPIVMLTAHVEESGQPVGVQAGLELGIDDYVTKPFSPRELVACVQAVLGRHGRPGSISSIVRVGELVMNLTARSVTVGGRPVPLTPTEFDLLAVLVRHPGCSFTRAQLISRVYDAAYAGYERAIDLHIEHLRQKIEPDPREPRYVLTACSGGYQLGEIENVRIEASSIDL